MVYEVNDEWSGTFTVTELGDYLYTVRAWVDHFRTWQNDLQKKFEAGQDVTSELRMGTDILRQTASGAASADAKVLSEWAALLEAPRSTDAAVVPASRRSYWVSPWTRLITSSPAPGPCSTN